MLQFDYTEVSTLKYANMDKAEQLSIPFHIKTWQIEDNWVLHLKIISYRLSYDSSLL